MDNHIYGYGWYGYIYHKYLCDRGSICHVLKEITMQVHLCMEGYLIHKLVLSMNTTYVLMQGWHEIS